MRINRTYNTRLVITIAIAHIVDTNIVISREAHLTHTAQNSPKNYIYNMRRVTPLDFVNVTARLLI